MSSASSDVALCPCGHCAADVGLSDGSDGGGGAAALSEDGRWFAAYASCCLTSDVARDSLPGVVEACAASIRAVVDGFEWRDCERQLFRRVFGGNHGAVASGDGWFSVGGVRRRSRNARRIAAACVLLQRPAFVFDRSVTREQYCIQLYDGHERCCRRYGAVYAAALAVLRGP